MMPVRYVRLVFTDLSEQAIDWLERKTAERVAAVKALGGSFQNEPDAPCRSKIVAELVEAAASLDEPSGGERHE